MNNRKIAQIVLIAVAYVLFGWLGLQIPFAGTQITLVWLPTGIAVAGVILWGNSVLPGIFIGAFLVNLLIGPSIHLAFGIAIGNTLAPLLSVVLLEQAGFNKNFQSKKDVALLIYSAAVGMTISSILGVLNLYLANLLPLSALGSSWVSWWMGDTVGVLLGCPVLITLNKENLTQLTTKKFELGLWLAIAIIIAYFSFLYNYKDYGRTLPLAFLTFPMFVWAALRFGVTGAGLAAVSFSIAAAFGTATQLGTFYISDSHVSLFLLWTYMTSTVLTGLLITALLAESIKNERSLRNSEEMFRALYEASIDAHMLTDPSVGFIDVNMATVKLFGCADKNEMLKYSPATTSPEYQPDGILSATKALHMLDLSIKNGSHKFEWLHKRKDGTLFNAEVILNQINLSGKTLVHAIVRDITEQLKNERIKSEFISTVSHELRTPLTSIIGGLALVISGKVAEIPSGAQLLLEIAYRNSQRLVNLINDLLDIEKLEAGKAVIELTHQPLMPLIDQAMESAKNYGEQFHVKFVVNEQAEVNVAVNSGRLIQVLNNFLSNAAKFAYPGTDVKLNIKKKNNIVRVEVVNFGGGIPETFKDQIFQKFSQADSSNSRKISGTGLGLAISKELIEKMNGAIGFESDPGKETVFYFELPVE